MILDSEALDCCQKALFILEGVRQGDDFRFSDFKLFKKTKTKNLSILEGGDDF